MEASAALLEVEARYARAGPPTLAEAKAWQLGSGFGFGLRLA